MNGFKWSNNKSIRLCFRPKTTSIFGTYRFILECHALRLHEMYRQMMIEDLCLEIAKGWDSPDSTMSVKDIVAKKRKEHDCCAFQTNRQGFGRRITQTPYSAWQL